jgi:integrase
VVRTVWTRRAVGRDVKRFVGWEKIIELADMLKQDPLYQAIYATTFLTGGRISEVLPLRRGNFVVSDKYLTVTGMPLLKHYQKMSEYIEERDERPATNIGRLFQFNPGTGKWWRKRYSTERVDAARSDFDVRCDEPLCALTLEWINNTTSDVLFLGATRWKAWQKFAGVGIYPHWLRAQRASCLISFWRFTMEEMMEWMGWEELTTARHYAKMGPKLREKFEGGQIPPRIRELEKGILPQRPPQSPAATL